MFRNARLRSLQDNFFPIRPAAEGDAEL